MSSLIHMGALPNTIYCFACGEKFTKSDPEGYEACPSCGKGFNDLSEEAQFAVSMIMKSMIEHFR
jgi:Zn finger protein HypA/HybF involved in hydrogenase expression